MSWIEITYFVIALIIMVIGLLGTILPVIPGSPIILAAAILYAILTDFKDITGNVLIVLSILAVLTYAMDWIASTFGVKKMGGSYFGVIGSLIGMVVGLLVPGAGLIGFIAGAFIGAFIFEFLRGIFFGKTGDNELIQALKAGIGTFIGFIVGGVLKFALSATMIGIFIWKIIGQNY